ncbi:hypothetical protein BT69DRAFT_160942 [Atractiella rhizophila]|nr:hypothetical protein BT69DRAFT_160942 [Atractiella rhizophila]
MKARTIFGANHACGPSGPSIEGINASISLHVPSKSTTKADLVLSKNDKMSEPETHKLTVSAQAFPIEEVTLYSKRAEVARSVTCALKKGDNEVVVGDLPTSLMRETLKYSTRSSSRTLS